MRYYFFPFLSTRPPTAKPKTPRHTKNASMAIFKTLKSLISRSSKSNFNYSSPKTLLTPFLSSPCPLPPAYLQPNHINIRRQFLFQSRFLFLLGGPIFLFNAPLKHSQSATPLLQSDVVLNFFKLRALNVLQKREFSNSVGHEYKPPKQGGEGSNGNEFTPDSENSGGAVVGRISDSYLNLPNCISFARMLSGPFLGWMIAHDLYSYAFVGLAISGASDWLDGYVARKMGINSVVGSYLDPLADKVLIGCVALSMVDKGLLHPGLVGLVLFRDVGLVGGAVYKRATSLDWKRNTWRDFFNLDQAHVQKVEPLFISKVNTVFQLALVAAALLQPDFGNGDTLIYINYLSWLVASTTVASTAAYGAQHLKAMKSTKFGK